MTQERGDALERLEKWLRAAFERRWLEDVFIRQLDRDVGVVLRDERGRWPSEGRTIADAIHAALDLAEKEGN